jgi:hypothetical protein
LNFVRIFSDREGESHFEDGEIELAETAFAPPAPPFLVSSPFAASGSVFASMPVAWFGDWHPTPRRQYWCQLSGELEVEVSDGYKRQLKPGSIVLVEDVEGRGHRTRVVGDSAVTGLFVQLADPS